MTQTAGAIRVDEAQFRAVMGEVCSPVAVITSAFDGAPHGTTVSAFASLSLEPAMVSVALDLNSSLLAMIRSSRRLGVNVLSEEQAELALRFARKGDDKFNGVEWEWDHGLPRLAETAGWLACDATDLVVAGDHVLLISSVEHAAVAPSPPLAYHRRTFGTHSAYA
ncbi:flavin reductase family protein [Nocardioides sp. Bht2]|uniref:flavin reductase family protein n=1 Tax=Nocardioides sp. Bht2 TaxID=3392297 RepID=UPI0039B54A57